LVHHIGRLEKDVLQEAQNVARFFWSIPIEGGNILHEWYNDEWQGVVVRVLLQSIMKRQQQGG